MDNLAHILKLTQKELKNEIYNYLQQKKMKSIFEDGFVYAEGDIPILLVAHMDTVFEVPPKRLFYDKRKDKISNPDGGLGGDDRCGVYAIMQLLEKYRPYVLFTEDEEIGCIGAKKAVDKLVKPNVKYIIEFDRRDKNDCVFYECGNYDFQNYIESFGFVTEYGTYSDVLVLGRAWNIASVNLSSGYYNEHTKKEYIIFHELVNNINRVEKMLRAYKKAPYFDYQEIQYKSSLSNSYFEDWDEEASIWWFKQKYGNLMNTFFKQNQDNEKELSLKKEKNQNQKKRGK